MDTNKKEERLTPPYAPYRTWNTLLGNLKDAMPLPSRMDSTFWSRLKLSGSMRSSLKSALVSLGLLSQDGRPKKELEELLIAEGDERGERLRAIFQTTYADLLNQIDLERATVGALRDYFRSVGADGQMGEKCQSFFINMAKDSGYKLHPHLLARAQPTGVKKRPGKKGDEGKHIKEDEARGRTEVEQDIGRIPSPLLGLLKRLAAPSPVFKNNEERAAWKKAFDATFEYLFPEKSTG